ncbi:MAG TPA: sialidase family protein [Bacteroidales bacterium]|nr:sialidase family protein [Bacteroidales bacterium]
MRKYYISSLIIFVLQTGCHQANEYTINLEATSESEITGENIISTSLYERDIAITSDGDEIIFTRGDYKQRRRCLISVKKQQNGEWAQAEVLNISGVYHDIEPFFSNNGNRLFFASNRPIYGDSSRNDYNIWFSDRAGEGWSEPVPLDSIINSKGDEFYPSLGNKGNLYFTATRNNGIGFEDIFISEYVDGSYKSPEPLPVEINSSFYEFNAFISPDEDYIIFSSYGRPEEPEGIDLYFGRKDASGKWEKSHRLSEKINSPGLDFCPFVDAGEGNFYFTSDRSSAENKRINSPEDIEKISNRIENGFGNIYRIAFKELHIRH